MIAVPAFLPVTVPFFTVATLVLLEDQVYLALAAFAGAAPKAAGTVPLPGRADVPAAAL